MASERSVKNLKMIPPTDIQTAYRDRQSRTAFVLLCGPLGPFCPSLSLSLPLCPPSLQGKKRFMSMAKILQQKIIKYSRTYITYIVFIFYVCRCRDIKIQRDKEIRRYKIHACSRTQTIFDKCLSLHFSL